MSVIVYGMEMPEHCGYCRFRYDGICHALQKTQYSMEDCPLIPVPAHGDLIDRDAMIVELMDRGVEGLQTDDWHEIQQAVADAPIIITADEVV